MWRGRPLDLWLPLLVILGGCGGGTVAGPDTAAVSGARLYARHCSACHQQDGKGLGEAQPALAGAPTVAGEPEPLIRWLLFSERPATLPPRRGAMVMPAFAWLSDGDLAALLTHVRGGFGNRFPPVTPEMVTAARGARR